MSDQSVFTSDSRSSVQVLVSPGGVDSTADLDAIAQAIGEGVREVIRDAEITLAPLPNGGAGTSELFAGQRITLPTTDAMGSLTEATYTYDEETTTAYIDLAAAAGRPAGPESAERGDTYGVGVLIADAETRGARRVVLALGDSVTKDAGTGILVALAVNPVDADGHSVLKGAQGLSKIADLDTAKLNVGASAMEWVLLADSMDAIDPADKDLLALCKLAGIDPQEPGYGAGGGTAIGLTWLSSIIYGDTSRIQVLPAVDVIADSMDLATHAAQADFVITAGRAATTILAAAPDATVGVLGEDLPGASVSASWEAVTPEAFRRAAAHLAADYLRISTVQG